MKKINKYQLIVIIISSILGIATALLIIFISPKAGILLETPGIVMEDYEELMNYAIEVAKGNSVNENEEIKIDKKIEGEFLKIKVETTKRYGIEASFPISFEDKFEIKNGYISLNAKIDLDKGKYLEYTKAYDSYVYIGLAIGFGALCSYILYMLMYKTPKELKED